MAKAAQDGQMANASPDAESGSPQAASAVMGRRGTARLRADSDATPARRNITLQLEADGSPKWETVTEKNRQHWREILSRRKTSEALGLASAREPGPPGSILLAEAATALFDALARFGAFGCSLA